MDILEMLKTENFWKEFIKYKIDGKHLSSYEEKDLKLFIEQKEYLPILEKISNSEPFSLPNIREINKKHSNKKRRVFVFDREENYVLKAIAYSLHCYDYAFPNNLYSFRKNIGVKRAISDLTKSVVNKPYYSYKVDISDYFNSVDTNDALSQLKQVLSSDIKLYNFIHDILKSPFALIDDNVVACKKGIMAGAPISGFLANLYLVELDRWFEEHNIIYARYSDDIIVFAETEELIAEYEDKIKSFLEDHKLTINQKKEVRTLPGEAWEFLGFCVAENRIDISDISLSKIKDKMRRKSHALVRWKKRNNVCAERAILAFIRHFNRKFFDNPKHHEVTWCRWYFPTITTSKKLHILDEYMVSCIRYIATGKHSKSNYNLRYEEIKALGYRNIVNSYHYYKKTTCYK